jgi:hypothetical protein
VRILHPRQAVRLGVLAQAGAILAQQRAPQRARRERRQRAHRGQPGHAGPAQQAQQHRLGLVVLVVRGGDAVARLHHAGEGRVARLARRGLGPVWVVGVHLHVEHVDRHAYLRREGAAVIDPAPGRGLEVVVHVQRLYRQSRLLEQVQQDGGIQAAAEGGPHGRAARQRRRLQLQPNAP